MSYLIQAKPRIPTFGDNDSIHFIDGPKGKEVLGRRTFLTSHTYTSRRELLQPAPSHGLDLQATYSNKTKREQCIIDEQIVLILRKFRERLQDAMLKEHACRRRKLRSPESATARGAAARIPSLAVVVGHISERFTRGAGMLR